MIIYVGPCLLQEECKLVQSLSKMAFIGGWGDWGGDGAVVKPKIDSIAPGPSRPRNNVLMVGNLATPVGGVGG